MVCCIGDNSFLKTAKVTLVEASAVAPSTADATVSIAVALAAAAVVGLAVVTKKH